MEQTKDNALNDREELKKSIIVAVKTVGVCFVLLMFLAMSIFVLFPKKSIEISHMFGLKKVEEYSYKRVYSKSNNATDLYNLIVFEQENGNYNEELKCIDEMIARDDYSQFCSKMDEASVAEVKDRNLLPYVANVNAYFISRKAICLYKQKSDDLTEFVLNQAKNGDLFELSFSSYVDLVYGDEKIASADKISKFSEILEKSDGEHTTLDFISIRIDNLSSRRSSTEKEIEQILATYSLMRTYRAKYIIYEMLGDDTKKTENYNLFNTEKNNLNNLINN